MMTCLCRQPRWLVLFCLSGIPFALSCDRPASQRLDAPVDVRSVSHESPGAWNQWRGGALQGVAPQSAPVLWNAQRGVAWKAALEGTGNSSPVVAQQRVVVTLSTLQSPPRLVVVCLDAETGGPAWQQEVAVAETAAHRKAGYASATPAIAAGRVFAYFGAAGLFCLDLDSGDLLWHQPFPHANHQWGAASSPMLYGDLVLQLVESENSESFLVALKQQDGSEVWKTRRDSRGCWTTPVIWQSPDYGPQVIINGSGHKNGSPGCVTSYALATGEELWRATGTADISVPTALVHGDMIISSSGSSGPLFALQLRAASQASPQAVELWEQPTGGALVPSGVAHQQRLYLISDGGGVTCRDLATGNVVWSKRLNGRFSSSLVLAGGRMYATSESGDVFVIRAADQFELLATNSLRERCLATPAVADGKLYVRTDGHVWCIDGKSTPSPGIAASNMKHSGEPTRTAGSSPASLLNPSTLISE